MSKIFVDAFEKRTGGTEMAVPATGKWGATQIADGTVTDAEYQYINTLSSNAQTQITARLPLAGGTMSGALQMADQLVQRPEFKDYAETSSAEGNVTGTVNIDMVYGNVVTATIVTGATDFEFYKSSGYW